jgi:predicted nucleotidyltransferase
VNPHKEMKDEQQKEYDNLVEVIFARPDLSEKDRTRFYELHRIVEAAKKNAAFVLIQELRIQKGHNDRFILSDNERKSIYEILEKKRSSNEGLNRFEYNYLSFIRWRYNIESTAQSPCIPDILEINIKEFKKSFCFNSKRIWLYNIFLRGLIRCAEVYMLETIHVIVGGSYVNKEKNDPKDVDVLILLPQSVFRNDLNNKKLNEIILAFKNEKVSNEDEHTKYFDLVKLPEDYSHNLYMAYELLTLLGNSVENKSREYIVNNIFHCRKVFKLDINSSDIAEIN